MEQAQVSEHWRRRYKSPTDIEAFNAKRKSWQRDKAKVINEVKERMSRKKDRDWDALEEN